jgi:hypothetical protein
MSIQIQLLLITLATLAAFFGGSGVDAKPLDSASSEVVDDVKLDGKIEFVEDKTERIVIEPLPGE